MKRILTAALISGFSLVGVAQADSFKNMSDAAGDSAEAGSRVAAAGGQVALGAVAVPLAVGGAIAQGAGSVANTIADGLWATANAPLPVDDEVVVAQGAPSIEKKTVNVTTRGGDQ